MGDVSYDLHKLGWRAFQDLVSVVLQTVLGQTFHAFADTNDAGRDGAFHGVWATPSDPATPLLEAGVSGATVAQCKFSASPNGTLTPTNLNEELEKAATLHRRGACDAYVLLTNLRVTGRTDQWLREQLAERGITQVLTLDGQWICQQISRSPALRRYVPRVYGLGDLGQILDERRAEQASMLLSRLRDDLETFVPTAPYRAAGAALANHGFALLLGEPAAGKSTIAATLSVAALDEWGCSVRRVDSAAELIAAWNPHEPDQLFWVDDAFGAIRHDPRLTDDWARRMDQIMTAVHAGARVILTSRDYIYRDARPYLKPYAYPLLNENAVVVDVSSLTEDEKRQLLYNHLKAGDQAASTLRRWRPYLSSVAKSRRFQPEVARRLGLKAFTREARLFTEADLLDYMNRPVTFLRDVLTQLGLGERAALGCVYLSGEGLAAPVTLDDRLTEAVTRLGATAVDVLPAFQRLDGTFLRLESGPSGDYSWRFRHPTIREGFAATVAADTNAVGILVNGLTDDELLRQIDCGGGRRGTLIEIPRVLYKAVAQRVTLPTTTRKVWDQEIWDHPVGQFLQYQCSDEFLRIWAQLHAADLPSLLDFWISTGAYWQPKVLGRLHLAGALPDALRRAAIEKLAGFAHEYFDHGWLEEPVRRLFTDAERTTELQRFKTESLPDLWRLIDESADGYGNEVAPAERYESAREAVDRYIHEFANDAQAKAELAFARRSIDETVAEKEQEYDPPRRSDFARSARIEAASTGGRDEYDDLDVGH